MTGKTTDSDKPSDRQPDIDAEAAGWVLRLDRGLNADERDAFFDWHNADPEHAAALLRQQRAWKRLDSMAVRRPKHAGRPNPDLLAPPLPAKARRRFRLLRWALAATITVAAVWQLRHLLPTGTPAYRAPMEDRRVLADGSIVKLNDGARIELAFTANERRVKLTEGEAFFSVAKDSLRPFVVQVQGFDVRAVGTAFNVRLGARELDILVAEGLVQFDRAPQYSTPPPSAGLSSAVAPALVEAHHLLSVDFHAQDSAPKIVPVDRAAIRQALAWQHGLLTFTARSLSHITEELNRINDVQLVIVDEELANMRFSGTISSDNAAGFARLMEVGFGARAEFVGHDRIILRRANPGGP